MPNTLRKIQGQVKPFIAPNTTEEEQNAPPHLTALMGANRTRHSQKLLNLDALRKAKHSDQYEQPPRLPSGGQLDSEWIKSILPTPKPGTWWEVPADDRGVRIKLRWRENNRKPVYKFARLGKRELERLLEKTYEEQKRALSGRIFRELYRRNKKDIAVRITPYIGSNKESGIAST